MAIFLTLFDVKGRVCTAMISVNTLTADN